MTDTVHTAAAPSPADDAATPQDGGSVDAERSEEQQGDEAQEPEDNRSLTELLEQLGRDLSALGVSETQLEAARNMPDVRRAARDIAGALIVVIAALTAFAFLNVAALDGLSGALPTWQAALVLAAAWIAVGVLLFGLMKRARRWLLWLVVKAPPTEAVEELERDRDTAGRAALDTIQRIGPALAIQIALATVPDAGEVAGGVVEVGENVIEVSDDIVEAVAEQLPGGGVVNQVWDVALMPGRFGVKVATTVLRRGKPPD